MSFLNGVKIGVVSLGCAKNLVDTELMLGNAKQQGAEIVNDLEDANVLLVNTCAFIGPAKEESINTILELAEYKEAGTCKALVVAGCLSQRYSQELLSDMPEVDAIIGTGDIDKLPTVIAHVLGGERFGTIGENDYSYDTDIPRLITTGSYAYLKIAEGCNHPCAFCAIPSIRGRYRSRKIESVVKEAHSLADQGIKEVLLIAQDTTKYGLDSYKQPMLPELLRQVDQVSGIEWIRILYTYPTSFTDELINTMAELEKVNNYIDLPLQHAHDDILAAMRRKGKSSDLRELIRRFRASMPDVALRSSFIVGFPGETDDHFRALMDFIEEAQFDHVGIFKYSPEEGTEAFDMEGGVPDDVMDVRQQEAMEVQRKISRSKNMARVGKEFDIIVDGPSEESELVYVGRTRFQAPEIDGVTYFGNQAVRRGEIVKARIIEAHDYDLVSEIMQTGGEDR